MKDDSLATTLTELEDAVTNSNAEIDRLRALNARLVSALALIYCGYRLAEKSTPSNLRRCIVDARALLDNTK